MCTSTGLRRCRLAIARIARRHRRRKERRLTRFRHRLENRLEIFGEAHVEHLVGFVEHDHLHGLETQRLSADVIERASGSRDDDVDAALERAQLLLHRLSAVDRQHATFPSAGHSGARLRRPASPARASERGSEPRTARSSSVDAPMRWSMGSANAAVLPVPVAAWPRTSLPASSGGMPSR